MQRKQMQGFKHAFPCLWTTTKILNWGRADFILYGLDPQEYDMWSWDEMLIPDSPKTEETNVCCTHLNKINLRRKTSLIVHPPDRNMWNCSTSGGKKATLTLQPSPGENMSWLPQNKHTHTQMLFELQMETTVIGPPPERTHIDLSTSWSNNLFPQQDML